MHYVSTRGIKKEYSAAQTIAAGIAPDGGLFVPSSLPVITESWLKKLTAEDFSYGDRAVEILSMYLGDYTAGELSGCVNAAYNPKTFDCQEIAPLVSVGGGLHVLELWHGPTSAFKDMALQLLPHLLTKAVVKTGEKSEIVILVATSGDTGKAALDGFKDVAGTKIIVFYPESGVSQIQKLQMVTQEGNNVAVIAVKGNFDDAQTGVKNIFNDADFTDSLAAQGYKLSSANSINWGRLVPQIVYYFSAYADLVKNGNISLGQKVNFAVPTGNFGNILALYYAKTMGLPANRLICASNSNDVLTEFLKTGVYNRKRQFHKTYSPSMDILISSNLERLLYHVTDGDTEKVCLWMEELKNDGVYCLDSEQMKIIKDIFYAGSANDEQTVAAIAKIYKDYNYVADPHTAVAWQVAEQYRKQSGDISPMVIVSTASPYKFSETALKALAKDETGLISTQSGFDMLDNLSSIAGSPPIPNALASLKDKKIRHNGVCSKESMSKAMLEALAKL